MWLDTKEYAGLCSEIRTRYANKVPKRDFFLYREHCYVYTCNRSHKIVCVDKYSIEEEPEVINGVMRRFKK